MFDKMRKVLKWTRIVCEDDNHCSLGCIHLHSDKESRVGYCSLFIKQLKTDPDSISFMLRNEHCITEFNRNVDEIINLTL